MTPNCARSGLSLFELLLAMALLAVISVGLAASLDLGLQLYARGDAISQRTDSIARRLQLRGLLASTLPPWQLTSFPHSFEGRSDGFSFTTLSGRVLDPVAAGLHVTVTTIAADGETSLKLFVATVSDDGIATVIVDSLLANSLSDLKFSYYDPAATPPGWQATWSDPNRLPALVRVEAAPGSVPDWPEFTVRLQMAG